jgi:hypothetical protein
MASNPPPIKFIQSKCTAKTLDDTMCHEFQYRLGTNKVRLFENGDAEIHEVRLGN